jgi:hypothetical protein
MFSLVNPTPSIPLARAYSRGKTVWERVWVVSADAGNMATRFRARF